MQYFKLWKDVLGQTLHIVKFNVLYAGPLEDHE